jgi:serine/threonine-protein phosphatase PGAM5
LTPLGRAQAKAAAARLKALIHGDEETKGSEDEGNASSASDSSSKARVRVMIHSTMARAEETADIIAAEAFPNVKREANALIREGAPVRPVPDTWRQKEHVHVTDAPRIEAGFRSIFFRRTARDDDEQGETSSSASASASASRMEEHEIIVCHGNVIRYSVLRALQLPPDAWLRIGLYNGSITRVEIRPDGGVSLRCLGDAGHMRAPDQLTHN